MPRPIATWESTRPADGEGSGVEAMDDVSVDLLHSLGTTEEMSYQQAFVLGSNHKEEG